MKVLVEPFGVTLQVEAGRTILETALDCGVDYPFACQQGQCGSCKSFLLEGEVEMGTRYNPLVCTQEERSRGLILACQSVPLTDCRVAVVEIGGEIVHTVRELLCEVTGIERPAPEAAIVSLEVLEGGPFNFAAGQYASLPFGDFAMANRPDVAPLEFHLPGVPAGLAPGALVRVRGPYGTMYLHDEHLGPILAFASGTGLAAVLSIVETALSIGMRQRIHLYLTRAYCEARLQALAQRRDNFAYRIVGSDLAEIIAQDCGDLSAQRAYVAGPAAMCESVRRAVVAKGMPDESCLSYATRTP